MSISISNEEFSYQTRVVVYNFLGLVPAQTSATTKNDSFGDGDWHKESLKDLPPLSLIQKLKDSETHLANVKSVCEEVKKKVKKTESNSDIKKPERNALPDSLLRELLMKSSERNSRNTTITTDDLNHYPTVTVIKKRKNFKVIESPSTGSKRFTHRDFNQKYKSPFPYQQSVFIKSDKTDGQILDSSSENTDIVYDSFDSPMDVTGQQDNDTNIPSPVTSTTTNSLISRQQSSISNGSKICSTYVDITDLNDEDVISSPELPSSTLELKKEISEALNDLEDEYISKASQRKSFTSSPVMLPPPPPPPPPQLTQSDGIAMVTTSPPPPPSSSSMSSSIHSESSPSSAPKSPESEVAERLRALGDRVNAEYEADLNATVQDIMRKIRNTRNEIDQVLRQGVQSLINKIGAGWTRVALLLVLGQRILYDSMSEGVRYTRAIAESVANMLEQETGDFIINHGGWNTVTEIDLDMMDADSNQIQTLDEDVNDGAAYIGDIADEKNLHDNNTKDNNKSENISCDKSENISNDNASLDYSSHEIEEKIKNNDGNFSNFDQQNGQLPSVHLQEPTNQLANHLQEPTNQLANHGSVSKDGIQLANGEIVDMPASENAEFKNSHSCNSVFSLDESTSFNLPSSSYDHNIKTQFVSDEDSAFVNSPNSSSPLTFNNTGNFTEKEDDGKIVEDDGKIVESNGHIVEDDGNIVEDDGKIVESNGHIVEDDGNIVVDDGKIVENDGNIVESNGKIVENDGKIVKNDGRNVENDGNIVEDDAKIVENDDNIVVDGNILEDNTKIIEDDGKISEDGGKLVEDNGKIVEDNTRIIVDDAMVIEGDSKSAGNDGNIVGNDGNNVKGDSKIVGNDGKIVESDCNIVKEDIKDDGNIVEDDGKIVKNDSNIVEGKGNIVENDGNIVEGDGNIAENDGNSVKDDGYNVEGSHNVVENGNNSVQDAIKNVPNVSNIVENVKKKTKNTSDIINSAVNNVKEAKTLSTIASTATFTTSTTINTTNSQVPTTTTTTTPHKCNINDVHSNNASSSSTPSWHPSTSIVNDLSPRHHLGSSVDDVAVDDDNDGTFKLSNIIPDVSISGMIGASFVFGALIILWSVLNKMK